MGLFTKTFVPRYDRFEVPHPQELHKIKDYDLLSPCEFYRLIDKECRTYASEATTLWVSAERAKCDQWKEAYENCNKWKENNDRDALEKVLNFERSLFKMRQIDLFFNNVWKLRDGTRGGSEPAHFNAPLPPFLRKPE